MRVIQLSYLFATMLASALLLPPAAGAHQNPRDCIGPSPEVTFSSATIEQLDGPVRDNDEIVVGSRISNAGESACDISDLKLDYQFPRRDGSPGPIRPVISDGFMAAGVISTGRTESGPYVVNLDSNVFASSLRLIWSATVHNSQGDSKVEGTSEVDFEVTRPRASVRITADPSAGVPPLAVRYTYSLTNSSLLPATDSTLPGLVPNGGSLDGLLTDENCAPVEPVSAKPRLGIGGLSLESILMPGESWEFSCSRTFEFPGSYSSRPVLHATSSVDGRSWPLELRTVEPDKSDVTVLGSDLVVTKSHRGDFLAGWSGEYKLKVTNNGNLSTRGEVTLVDKLPQGLKATAIAGAGWNCSLAGLTCRRSDALASGLSYPEVTLSVKVAADPPGNVINRAVVSGGGEFESARGNNTAEDPTRIRTPATPGMASSSFRVAKPVSRADGNVVVKVSVPRQGRIVIDDARRPDRVRRTVRRVAVADTYRLLVKPGNRLRRQVQRSKRPRSVRIKVSFRAKGRSKSISAIRTAIFLPRSR